MKHLRRSDSPFRVFCAAAMLLLSPAVIWPQNSLLDQWRQALAARLEFESGHPSAARLFAGGSPPSPAAFLDSLRGPIWVADSSLRGWNLAAQALIRRAGKAGAEAPI